MTTPTFNRTRALELIAVADERRAWKWPERYNGPLIGAQYALDAAEQLRLAVERIAELEGRIGGMCEFIKDNV